MIEYDGYYTHFAYKKIFVIIYTTILKTLLLLLLIKGLPQGRDWPRYGWLVGQGLGCWPHQRARRFNTEIVTIKFTIKTILTSINFKRQESSCKISKNLQLLKISHFTVHLHYLSYIISYNAVCKIGNFLTKFVDFLCLQNFMLISIL